MVYSPTMGAFRLSGQEAGGQPDYMNALQQAMQGTQNAYKTAYTPKSMAEQLLASQLENKINTSKANWAERLNAADVHYKEALANKAGQPAALSGELPQLFTLRNQYQKDTPEYNIITQDIERIARGTAGTQLSIDPKTGALSFSQGGSISGGKGNQPILTTDENGNQIVVRPPTTSSITSSQDTGTGQVGREVIQNSVDNPYVGSAPALDFAKDLADYKLTGNPAAEQKLIDAVVFSKIAPEYAINQLQSQGAKPTVSALQHQYKALKLGSSIFNDKLLSTLPRDIIQKANEKHNKLLKDITSAKQAYSATGFPVKLPNKESVPTFTDADIKNTALKYGLTVEQVKKDILAHHLRKHHAK